jgi:hypothetical protein
MRDTSSRRRLALACALASLAAGCASVQPWQRARLADRCMIFDANGSQVAFDAHWQEAREGSAGGFGIQSGGCGCK